MNKCEICNKEILNDSQFIDGKWYHNKCIKNCKIVLDKIKEIFKDYGVKENIVCYSMYRITGEEVYTILELLEEIE